MRTRHCYGALVPCAATSDVNGALEHTRKSMAELELYNHVSENKRDCLEQDLAEKLTRESPKNSSDELQLAALLGKTLLEKNAELEQKLRRLQEFAGEALAANETLSRQLSESKDSLHFSNKLCEQLEARIEELERNNSALQKLNESHEAQLEQKATAMHDLEEKLESVQREYQRVKEHSENLELNQVQAVRMSGGKKALRKKSTSFSGELAQDSSEHVTALEREQELLKTVEELTEKFRVTSYQKQKYEKGLREVLLENQSLARSLERAETDVSDLQGRLRAYEEAMEKQSLERSYGSPMPHTLSVSSTPTLGNVFHYGSITSPSEDTHRSVRTNDSTLGTSLFSELDSQYSDLQEHYDQLVQQCTCSAGLAHRNRLKLTSTGDYTDGLSPVTTQPKANTPGTGMPFKDLFDEVFSTLQQTAAVADKLIERNKSRNCV